MPRVVGSFDFGVGFADASAQDDNFAGASAQDDNLVVWIGEHGIGEFGGVKFAQDGGGGAATDAVGAGVDECGHLGGGANAAGGLDADALADDAAHEGDV